jgi:hypothetical protein
MKMQLHSTQEVSSKYMIDAVSNQKITVAATAQRLSETSSSKKILVIRADEDNTGKVYWGSSNIDGDNSDYLNPGEVRILYFIDPYILYVKGTAEDKVYYNTLE